MGHVLWFSRVLDIGTSAPSSGRPVSQLTDYTVKTRFEIVEGRIDLLRQEPWVEQVHRRGRNGTSLQLLVRWRELPPELSGTDCHEVLRARLLRLLRGW